MRMILINIAGERMTVATWEPWAASQPAIARALWRDIAGQSAAMVLQGFEVQDDLGNVLYRGDYVTDEC